MATFIVLLAIGFVHVTAGVYAGLTARRADRTWVLTRAIDVRVEAFNDGDGRQYRRVHTYLDDYGRPHEMREIWSLAWRIGPGSPAREILYDPAKPDRNLPVRPLTLALFGGAVSFVGVVVLVTAASGLASA